MRIAWCPKRGYSYTYRLCNIFYFLLQQCRSFSYRFNPWTLFNFSTHQDISPFSCKVFCSSIDVRRVSLVSLVLWFPLSKICHSLLPADPPTSSPLTLAYICPSPLFPSPFIRSPSLAKSPSPIQLFGSTQVSLKAFATQSNLSLSAPEGSHDTSLRHNTLHRTSLQFGSFLIAVATNAYKSYATKSRFLFVLKSLYPRE